jgi:hypothetical protein
MVMPFAVLLTGYGPWITFFALLSGLLRKFGKPELKKTELRKYIFMEDLQMMGYMSVASFSHGSVIIMMYAPVMLHGYLTCAKTIQNPQHVGDPWKRLLIPQIKNLFVYGTQNSREITQLKADMEVYTGFYLIFGWFLGMTQLFSILLYWQVARVRCMLETDVRQAFARFDTMLFTNVISKLPPILQKPYTFIKNFMVSMGSPP